MLDTDTKRRIDTARDMLVGKVPDPKSQVEQITIALIYKFMDDMDAESEEFGGKRKFFAGEFARYGWAKLMRSGLGGFDTLNLYAEAIAKMPENPGIPLLFRDIFKNAYLPYRDPETLRAFLKIIDEFTYDHSERLGDAFEYLLSVLGSQGDAGQFRTPRHIIDFMVEIIDPKKNETMLDPACGTAGFPISAYKHILAANRTNMDRQDGQDRAVGKSNMDMRDGQDKREVSCASCPSMSVSPSINKGNMDKQDAQDDTKKSRASRPSMFDSSLTPDEKGRIAQNFRGYDISPDMVRLSLVNMYLHGFADPHIAEYDTLTSLDKWNEHADVILANPPFMSPKGGIKPHNRFSVQSKRSEVLFVDYMAEHLTPTGRAGIIVPEGIIFQSQTAYKDLRKMLVENYLVAVVSLPVGVFNPYSGVKTSILILDKLLARQSKTIAFFKIENDGFGLGAQRREIDKNDLPQAQAEIAEYMRRLRAGESVEGLRPMLGLVVEKERLAANGEYNLSGERYRQSALHPQTKWPSVRLGDICTDILSGGTPSTAVGAYWNGTIPWMTSADIVDIKTIAIRKHITQDGLANSASNLIPRGNIIVVTRVGLGKIVANEFDVCISQDSQGLILDRDRVVPDFLLYVLAESVLAFKKISQGTTIQGITKDTLRTLEIPLPPLGVQKEIVAEIEGYQKVIDGARAVLDSYRPRIPVRPEWPMVRLETISTIVRGSSPRPQGDARYFEGPVPRLMVADITRDGMYTTPQIDSLTEEGATKSRPMRKDDVIITVSGNPGLPTILAVDACIHDGFVGLRELRKDVLPEYLYFSLLALHSQHGSQSIGAVFKNLTTDQIREFNVPLPPFTTQQAIVAEIEAEQTLVAANRELIERFEKKIQATLARVWGEKRPVPEEA